MSDVRLVDMIAHQRVLWAFLYLLSEHIPKTAYQEQ